jgi:LPS-assembly protein
MLEENVLIGLDKGSINASSATYLQNQNFIKDIKNGNIYHSENYFKFLSGSLEKDSGNLQLINGEAYLRERNLLVQYQSLNGSLGYNMKFQNANLSSCNNIDEGWEIKAKTILINEESDRGHIEDLTLKVLGKTVLKLPYLPFPTTTERLSGFLEPELSLTSDGLDLYLPYFWVLSKKSDLTIAPRILKDRGSGLEANYRYLTKSNSNSSNFFDLLFFPKDKEFRKNYSHIDDDRWAFRLKEERSFSTITTFIDWAKSSDSMVLQDLPSSLTRIANQRDHYLTQSISVNMLLNNLSINFARQGFQSLNPFITNGYVKKPEVNLEYKKYGPSFSYFAKANYADFDINKNQHLPVNIPEITKTGKRLITEIGIEALHDLKYFDLSINGLLVNKKYNLDYTKSNAKAISIPTIEIKISSFLRQSSERNRALLIPELIYQKTNYKDQSMNPIFDLHQRNFGNLNRPNTRYFFGKDRVPDMEFLLARLKWQKKIDKDSRLYLQISKKNELESSKVINEMLNQPIEKDSQIGTNLSYENIRVRTYLAANYSQKRNKLNFGKSGVEIKLPEMRLSFSRNFQNNIPLLNNTNELDYAEFSIEKLMSNGYKFIGGISKDLDSKKNLETYVGFGYENCCVAFKLYASDKRLSKYNFLNAQAVQFNDTSWDKMIEIENKSRINFEFELKGLTGGNRKINSFFSNTFLNL